MPQFIVRRTAILHDGKRYDIGETIELTAEQAENNALNLQAVENAEKVANSPSDTEPDDAAGVTEEDVAKAEAQLAEAEKAKGKKK